MVDGSATNHIDGVRPQPPHRTIEFFRARVFSQFMALATMRSRSSCCGIQPSSRRARLESATTEAASPGRRGPIETSKSRPWTRRTAREVYANPWLKVTEFDAVAPTGKDALYGVVHFRNHAVGVLPLHDDGTVTLVGQHRFVSGDYSWELPEGGSPLGVDPLETARRELAEEAGLAAREWRQVLLGQLSNSVSDELCIGFVATGLSQAEAEPDETEVLALARVPFSEALDQALCGGIQDMITVAILLRAYHMAREGALPEPLAKAMLEKAGDTP